MIKILSEGDGKHRVENEREERIGWIRGLAIGFRGFATEDGAREAAVAARHCLDRMIQSQHNGWPSHSMAASGIHTVHDGAYEWFFDGTIAIARLLRPQRRAYDMSFAIELVLPSFASDGLAVTAAHALCSAVAPYRDERDVAVTNTRRTSRPVTAPDTSTFY